MTSRISTKQRAILSYLDGLDGQCTADVHRAVCRYCAHGHHKFTYETVARLIKRGLLTSTRDPADGRRGVLSLTDRGRALLA